MTKKLTLTFRDTDPKTEGLKFVLFAVTDADNLVTHDWGFANWNGKGFDGVEVPEGYKCEVVWWADNADPVELLAEESKIIKL